MGLLMGMVSISFSVILARPAPGGRYAAPKPSLDRVTEAVFTVVAAAPSENSEIRVNPPRVKRLHRRMPGRAFPENRLRSG